MRCACRASLGHGWKRKSIRDAASLTVPAHLTFSPADALLGANLCRRSPRRSANLPLHRSPHTTQRTAHVAAHQAGVMQS